MDKLPSISRLISGTVSLAGCDLPLLRPRRTLLPPSNLGGRHGDQEDNEEDEAKASTIRGGSARTAARSADTGAPPAGALDEAAVEKAVTAWKTKQVKTRSDYVPYGTKALIADAKEMVGGVDDLPRFAALKAPIGERDFTWLRLLTDALVLIGDDVVGTDAAKKTLSRDAEVAIEAVRAARTQLSRDRAAEHPAVL